MEVNSTDQIGITEDDIDRFDADRGGTVDRSEFANAVKSFPALLRPAYKLQRSLRESTLSLRRWEQIADKSKVAELTRVEYVDAEDEELEIIELY